MGYSTSDAERISRLEAATRAARRIVEQAKAEGQAIDADRQSEDPVALTVNGSSTLTPYEPSIRRPNLCG